MSPRRSFKVAAVSATPVFMDRDATVEKACGLIAEAAGQGAELIVFPETFIPTYPMWVWEIPASEGGLMGELQAELVEQSVEIPGPATDRLCEAARQAGAHIVMGVNEPVTDNQRLEPVQHDRLHRRRRRDPRPPPQARADGARTSRLDPR